MYVMNYSNYVKYIIFQMLIIKKKFLMKYSQNIRKDYTVKPVKGGYRWFLKKVSPITKFLRTRTKISQILHVWTILRRLAPAKIIVKL